MVAGFPQSMQYKRTRQKRQFPNDPVSEVRLCHFCHILLVTQTSPYSVGEGLYKGMKSRQQGSLGAKLEDGNSMYLTPVPRTVPGIITWYSQCHM